MLKLFSKNNSPYTLEQKSKKWDLVTSRTKAFIFIVILIFELIFLGFLAKKYGMLGESVPTGAKIAMVDFNKEITNESVNKVIKVMDKIKKDLSYKEILFIMNSPGGSPTASEELSEYLKAYNKDKNVTMYIQGIAASGGYYIASAIKPLYANKNAIVGSIGVILPHYSIKGFAEKVGIEEDDLSAGEYKKPITYFRKLSEKEKTYLKAQMITPTYQNFIDSVSQNRGITKEALLPYTEGKIFIANDTSIQNILIDNITVLTKLKEKLKEKYRYEISFADLTPKEVQNPFGAVNFNIKLDSAIKETLKLQ